MSQHPTLPLDDHARADPSQWPLLSDTHWVELHVPRYAELRPRFEQCAAALVKVLDEAKRKLAPEAIIQVRAKELPSFAEKILRKRAGYVDPRPPLPPDPLLRMTDLCGGRVICQSEEQVQAVSRFLEQHFDIDWENSDDAARRLRTTEFGYRTINRIVSFAPGRFPPEKVPESLCGEVPVPGGGSMRLKMEIQVRTVLAHAWADVSHDLAYKTEVRLPERIRRDLASKAAILEETDRAISRLIGELEAYRSNYGAHLRRDEVEAEIALQRIVLGRTEKPGQQAALAVKIAKLCLAAGKQADAEDVLRPFAEQKEHHAVQRTLGQALTELHEDEPAGAGFHEGCAHLRLAATTEDADAETFCMLGEAMLLAGDASAAAESYHQAITRDAAEPASLARFLEHEVAMHRDHGLVRLAEPMIRDAMNRCRAQIEGCVNLPGAWSALSLLHLLVREPHPALDAMAHLLCLCEQRREGDAPGPCAASRHVHRLQMALHRLASIRESLPGHAAMERALLIALALRGRDENAMNQLRRLASWTTTACEPHFTGDEHAVIFAGGCASEVNPFVEGLKTSLTEAFAKLSPPGRRLVILSGGTTAGMSGLAGDLAQASKGAIKAFGYLPETVPSRYMVDHDESRFARLCLSPGHDFTVLDPLQGWIDLAAAGVPVKQVKLLAFAPGEISRAEIAFALALGARVALIEHSGLPPGRQFDDSTWRQHLEEGSFIRLPMDAMTLRAFLLTDQLPDADARFEAAARQVHESYLKSARPADPSLSPWDSLPEALKVSNYHQVAYWANILATEGLHVRRFGEVQGEPVSDMPAEIGGEAVRRLAKMEHGRWNVERLLRGWRWAERKDVARKLSPYLVPWEALSPEIQGYDVSAIINLPKNLAAAGFEIHRDV